MSFSRRGTTRTHRAFAQDSADDARLNDAEQRSLTIVGDEDAHWLIRQVEDLQGRGGVIRSGSSRTFCFLPDGAEAVMNNAATGYTLITMPAGSIISRVSGSGYRSWVFRVDNGLSGSDREYFDLDYCKIATDAHMLRLKSRIRGDKQPK